MRPCRGAMTPATHLGVLVGTICYPPDALPVTTGSGGFGVPVF